jgi:hypothetical protein
MGFISTAGLGRSGTTRTGSHDRVIFTRERDCSLRLAAIQGLLECLTWVAVCSSSNSRSNAVVRSETIPSPQVEINVFILLHGASFVYEVMPNVIQSPNLHVLPRHTLTPALQILSTLLSRNRATTSRSQLALSPEPYRACTQELAETDPATI